MSKDWGEYLDSNIPSRFGTINIMRYLLKNKYFGKKIFAKIDANPFINGMLAPYCYVAYQAIIVGLSLP